MRRLLTFGTTVVSIMLFCFAHTSAQGDTASPKVEARATVGGIVFDEVGQKVVGGSVRYYITKRVSVEPEVMYRRGSETDQDYLFQPNIAYDFGGSERLVPYVIAGAGVIHHEGSFSGFDFVTGAPQTFDTSYTTWTASAGLGVKIFVTKRLFVAPEGRLGREPALRGTISVGYVFDKE